MYVIPGENPHIRHAVLVPTLEEGMYRFHFLVVKGQDQCPNPDGKGVLVAPTVHGNLIVGPNAEGVDRAEDVNNTAAGLAFVRKMSVSVTVSHRQMIRP